MLVRSDSAQTQEMEQEINKPQIPIETSTKIVFFCIRVSLKFENGYRQPSMRMTQQCIPLDLSFPTPVAGLRDGFGGLPTLLTTLYGH